MCSRAHLLPASHSGHTRLLLHRLTLRETDGLVGPAPFADAGTILDVWKPKGWEDEDMLSLQAVFGGMSQDRKLLIQDHLQV